MEHKRKRSERQFVLQISTYKMNKATHCVAFVSLLLDINLIRTDYVKVGTEKKVETFFFP